MNSREFAIDVVRRLTQAGHVAYWAGGCVRDLLMGREPGDFDIATDATPERVRELFGKNRTLAVGQSFGVIIVLGPQSAGQVEVATFRTEGEYKDGRRPDSVAFCTPEEDAQRRDFTINGMFYDPLHEQVHDYVGGQADLKRKVLRAIGDPFARMSEDKLRMLRAVRFTALLNFTLDSDTASAVSQMASQLVLVSAERIAQELRKMLAHPRRPRALQLLRDLGLLALALPEIEQLVHLHGEELWNQKLHIQEQLGDASFNVAMGTLHRGVASQPEFRHQSISIHGTVQSACRRLKLSNEESEQIVWLVEAAGRVDQAASSSLSDLKRLCQQPLIRELLHIERVERTVLGTSLAGVDKVEQYLSSTPAEIINPPMLLTGTDLIRLGHKPGHQFRVWLDAIRDAQLNEQIASREEAIHLLARLFDLRPE